MHHKLVLTMVAGKGCNAVANISSQKFYVCGATPKDMNNLDSMSRKIENTANFTFGLCSSCIFLRVFITYFVPP
jgi:uncharacterized protein YozE (UPF0346 family)